MRKTKIICTIGPASEKEETLRSLIKSGMNAARLNFSHGDYEEHGNRIKIIKKLRKELDEPVAIILDTKGPEIRTGYIKNESVPVHEGQKYIITTRDVDGDDTICSVTYKGLNEDVKPGDRILIDDGLVGMKVEYVDGQDIHCIVMNNGAVGDHKNMNLPGVKIKLPALTEKDINDLKFGIENGIDIVAASFIRTAEDVLSIKKVLEKNNAGDIAVISKVESQEGLNNIDDIIRFSDGVMVARGDLGVQIPTEDVPLAQKMIIEKCNQAGKIVVTATQMLDSMIRNPRPTRAEASDVANAIFDGTDAIMLSGETASGKYPVEALSTMRRIAEKVDKAIEDNTMLSKKSVKHAKTIPDAVSYATVTAASELSASAIITATQSGNTAKMVSKYRPKCPIIAVTPNERAMRKLAVVWGVYPLLSQSFTSEEAVMNNAIKETYDHKFVKKGDLIVLAAGMPIGFKGTTNLMRVHIVGDVLVKGSGMGTAVYGDAFVARTEKDLDDISDGDILVVKTLFKGCLTVLDRVSGVITEEGGLTSHLAIECISRGIPIIVGAKDATKIIKNGSFITMDSRTGAVYTGKANVR